MTREQFRRKISVARKILEKASTSTLGVCYLLKTHVSSNARHVFNQTFKPQESNYPPYYLEFTKDSRGFFVELTSKEVLAQRRLALDLFERQSLEYGLYTQY